MRFKFQFDPGVLERIKADMEAIDQETNRKQPRKEAASVPKKEEKVEHFGPCVACDGKGLDRENPDKLCSACEGSGKILQP